MKNETSLLSKYIYDLHSYYCLYFSMSMHFGMGLALVEKEHQHDWLVNLHADFFSIIIAIFLIYLH